MKEKQIEEMACGNCLHHFACLVNSEYVPTPCPAYEDKEGYRKQSEGEWIWTVNGDEDYEQFWICSVCNEKSYIETKFCSDCGARMKGSEQMSDGKDTNVLTKWISVEDRLPKTDARVLVYMHENRMSYTRIDTDRMAQGEWVRWGDCVTHWMPLPDVPKMKGGEGDG